MKLIKKNEFVKFDLMRLQKLTDFYNNIKNKSQYKQYIEADIDELEGMFKSLFNDEINDKQDDPDKVKVVDEFMKSNRNKRKKMQAKG